MSGIVVIFFLVFATVQISGSPKIVNGTDAYLGEYPFQVSVRYDDQHLCGGTILNSKWILTAAHCIWSTENLYSIQAGVTDISEDSGPIIDVKQFIRHENYSRGGLYVNDIAVLQLESSLPMGKLIQPTKLPKRFEKTVAGTAASVIGWGTTYSGGEAATTLKTVNITVWSDTACAKVYPKRTDVTNICAGVPQGGKGQCTGDSGGPLLVNNMQVGIVSWSAKPCAKKGYPGVFTKVSYYIDWINRKINQ